MDQVTLRTEPRTETGTRPAKRLRREGRVPAIVYGRGIDPVSVTVAARELSAALHTEAGVNALIALDGDYDEQVIAVAREIQVHPVRGEITHLDLVKVSLDTAIQAEVAIEYIGDPVGTKEGGFVETIETSVLIEALPTGIPASIAVDVEHLDVGDTLKVGDLPSIEGVEYLDDEDRPLVTVIIPRVVEEEEEVLEGEEIELDEHGEPIEVEGEEAADEEAASEEG